uniref:Uncharacterized protein n=1 Tax=Saccharum hybrid cultivar R570 TaxID=131158 RepID=A0A059Q0F1_9POAL|nr:hypothetical protein SHCRBa_015_N03_F_20 [Saccharum hybrid cultivar R570]
MRWDEPMRGACAGDADPVPISPFLSRTGGQQRPASAASHALRRRRHTQAPASRRDPRLRRPSARTYWPRPLSSSHVTPAAAAGVLEPPDLTRLAQRRAHLALPAGGLGNFRAVDLESIEPSLRAGTTADSSLREDKPETFDNRDAHSGDHSKL